MTVPTLTVEISDFMLEKLQESNNAIVITLSNGDSDSEHYQLMFDNLSREQVLAVFETE